MATRRITATFYLPLPQGISVPEHLRSDILTTHGLRLTSISTNLKGTADQLHDQWMEFYWSCLNQAQDKAREYKADLIIQIDGIEGPPHKERVPHKLESGRTPEKELQQLRMLIWLIARKVGVKTELIDPTLAQTQSEAVEQQYADKVKEHGWTVLALQTLKHLTEQEVAQ